MHLLIRLIQIWSKKTSVHAVICLNHIKFKDNITSPRSQIKIIKKLLNQEDITYCEQNNLAPPETHHHEQGGKMYVAVD